MMCRSVARKTLRTRLADQTREPTPPGAMTAEEAAPFGTDRDRRVDVVRKSPRAQCALKPWAKAPMQSGLFAELPRDIRTEFTPPITRLRINRRTC